MKTRIVHARISENNTVNGKAGDQTKQEVRVQDWYNRPWNVVIRNKNIKKREEFADFLVELANNENVGYGQGDRNTLITELDKCNWNPKKVGPCNCDCSSFVTAGLIAVGYPREKLIISGNCLTTRNMKKILLDLPDFFALGQMKYTASCEDSIKGDIYLSEGHHVAVNITDGKGIAVDLYFPKYKGNSESIVDALKSLGVDSSPDYRKKIATANGIVNPGSAEGNMIMLVLLKNGALKQP